MQVQAQSSRSRVVVSCFTGVLGVLLASPGLLGAQSLAEVARQEEARRKTIKGQTKTYTNRDLGRGAAVAVSTITTPPSLGGAAAGAGTGQPAAGQSGAGGATAQPDQTSGQPASEPKPTAPAPGSKGDEPYWRKRVTEVRDKLSQAQTLAAALQSRIAALTADFVNRDDPAQRAQIAQDRQKALDELARMTKEIERLKKEVADIQDEGRKAGVPPGWLR